MRRSLVIPGIGLANPGIGEAPSFAGIAMVVLSAFGHSHPAPAELPSIGPHP
jgi:hypothetical protein